MRLRNFFEKLIFSSEEVLLGPENGISIIKKAVSRKEKFSLMIDAHRVWSLNFKENSIFTNQVSRVALIGNDKTKFRAQKQYMEPANFKFFMDGSVICNQRVWTLRKQEC